MKWSVARSIVLALCVTALFTFWSPSVSAGTAPKPAFTSTGQTPLPAGSYLLVDNDTGDVLDAYNEHADLPPASITKLLTALVAVNNIARDQPVPISAAAAGMPAMKIDAKQGQMWQRDQLLNSLLLVSANDAAVALAEASAGNLDSFSLQRADAAKKLGLQDNPAFNDPAGLDDAESSNNGGDLVSARDMAIIARAALAEPEIRSVVAQQRYSFVGPDGANHTLRNHNQLLNRYTGAVGMKTGYTQKAKHTFVGAAERNGRTLIAVVMGGNDPYSVATTLLDRGFAGAAPTRDNLGVVGSLAPASVPDAIADVATTPAPSQSDPAPAWLKKTIAFGAIFGVLALLVGLVRDPAYRAEVAQRLRERWNGGGSGTVALDNARVQRQYESFVQPPPASFERHAGRNRDRTSTPV